MQCLDEIKTRLRSGNERFVSDTPEACLQDSSRRQSLTETQAPFAVILSCADSRVAPELVFDTGLGELFIVRVAGNVANTSTIASIEYAVANLGTKVVVVMGHESCGAVIAAIQGGDNGNNLNHLLAHIEPAYAAAEDNAVETVVKKNTELTALELTKRSPIIQQAVESGQLTILTAYYELGSGKVIWT